MAMNLNDGGGDGDVMVDINTTPLIDVMLVLLIMLIITIPIQTHAVKLNMPVNDPNQPKPPHEPVVVEIVVDFDGTIGFGGEIIKDRADLETHLYRLTQQPEQPEVHLIPNKLAPYKYVAEVMAEAQRLGVTKIGIVGNEQFTH